MSTMDLRLCYGPVVVGRIAAPFEHQGTWFGLFLRASLDDGDPTQRRLFEFLAFSQAWHDRLARGEDPEAAEFDAFADLLESGLWYTRDDRGAGSPIEAPLVVDGELSWQVA